MSKLTTDFTPVAWLVMGSQGHYVEFDNEHGGIPLYTQEQASTIIRHAERLGAMLTESVQALKAAEQRIEGLEAKQAKREAQPAEWSGWACQYPGHMPRLYGDKAIAEVNCDYDGGMQLLFLSSAPPAPAVPDEATAESVEALSGYVSTYKMTESERDIAAEVWNACRAAMLAAAPGTKE